MKFDKNKSAFIHQWYPFVEGYSKEFISGIISELDYKPNCCFEPFVGSGTTPVELQQEGIKCISFEVSPFMHLLATVKLESTYQLREFEKHYRKIDQTLNELKNKAPILTYPVAETLVERKDLDKWIYNKETFKGILDIKLGISQIKDLKYQNLFKIALASILLEVSNVFRNGKCVSYRKDWKEANRFSRRSVHKIFLCKLRDKIREDIGTLESQSATIMNKNFCYLQDVRKGILNIPDKSVDLMITSPPYLNSRDYTDIYRIELWVLDLITSYDDMLSLRKQTVISHVQYRLDEFKTINSTLLKKTIRKIENSEDKLWNVNITRMIKGYFRDMDYLFFNLRDKMIKDKMIYFNIANSAYSNVEVKVDEIICEIAEMNGFKVQEIRKARDLKSSGQQKMAIKSLQESVIVIKS